MFVRSNFLLALFLIVVLGAALRVTQPLRMIESSSWDENPIQAKLRALSQLAGDPSFIILGSSLSMSANALADDRWQNGEHPLDRPEYNTHAQTLFLDHELSELTRKKVAGIDLSCEACMPGDAVNITRYVFDRGKKTGALIYCVGSRDFLDGRTQNRYDLFMLAPQVTVRELLQHDFQTDAERLYGDLSHLYRVRWDFKRVAIAAVQAMRFPSEHRNVFATYPLLNAPMTHGRLRRDLAGYKRVYSTANTLKENAQWQTFHELCALCRQHGTALYVVNMPLTPAHKERLLSGMYEEYRRKLSTACAQENVALIDIDREQTLKMSDFFDSVHLNGAGGMKTISYLARRLAELESRRPICDSCCPTLH
ncbi:MAG: hypothetical protein ACRD3W_16825 [Terriglobales bacterium]